VTERKVRIERKDGSLVALDDWLVEVYGPNWRDISKEKVNPFAKSPSGSSKTLSTKKHTR
jgi:hypothetical protein